MTNIAILPARLGSKRIKEKNIKNFYSKPMIQWTYEILKKTKIFSHIYVSTESNKIIRVCKKIGIKSFIHRPKNLSGDNIGIREVMDHAVKYLDNKIKFKNTCCVFPCSPFLRVRNLKKALIYLKNKKNCVVHPVLKFRHPPERSLTMDKNNFIRVVNQKNMTLMTQSFTTKYHDLGQFYFSHKSLWSKKPYRIRRIGIELPIWDTVDLDNLEDWEFARLLFKLRKKKEF